VSQSPPAPFPFRRRHRLSRSRDYQAAYDARTPSRHGPLLVFSAPNGLAHARLGLSVGRRVGNAVRRNTIKRRLREAFRLLGADGLPPLDLVVTVRPHRPMPMDAYRSCLADAIARAERRWRKRGDRAREAEA
jgi:ribonuclease P protein component